MTRGRCRLLTCWRLAWTRAIHRQSRSLRSDCRPLCGKWCDQLLPSWTLRDLPSRGYDNGVRLWLWRGNRQRHGRCDYREVNEHVVMPQQPLPRTDDILASFKGKRYFSVMDMCHGFSQIEIGEEDRTKTGFMTPYCQRQYRRLPFGFASSPAIF